MPRPSNGPPKPVASNSLIAIVLSAGIEAKTLPQTKALCHGTVETAL
jgi:hypothetical protein